MNNDSVRDLTDLGDEVQESKTVRAAYVYRDCESCNCLAIRLTNHVVQLAVPLPDGF